MDPSTSENDVQHQPEILQQQQIELVEYEYEFPTQQCILPELSLEEQLADDENDPKNKDYLLFMDAGSVDFSRVPEDLQPKLRKEYFKVLRSRDSLAIDVQNYQDETRDQRVLIDNLNHLMMKKNSELTDLQVAMQRNEDNPDGEAPSPVNFSQERAVLYQQLMQNNARLEKMKREAVDNQTTHEQRYTLLKAKLDESSLQLGLLEVEKNELQKQNLKLKKKITKFNAKLAQLENNKKREMQEVNQFNAELKGTIVQREAELAHFKKLDKDRLLLAQKACALQKTTQNQLELFKDSYLKDVKTLQAKNKKLSEELKTAKSSLASIFEKQFAEVFPVLFASVPKNTTNLTDLLHVAITEKKKNIQLEARIAQLKKVEAGLNEKLILTLKHAADDLDDEPEINIKKDDASIVVKTEPEDSEVEISAFKPNEAPSSELGEVANLDDRTLRDRYLSVLNSSHRFYLANQNLNSLFVKSELDLKEVQKQNIKLNAELDEMKRIEAGRESEQLKQNQDIKSSMDAMDLHIEQNRFLKSRIEERNTKLKQLEENLVQVKRENTKWFTELKQAQAKTHLASEREENMMITTCGVEQENDDLKIHLNSIQQELEGVKDDLDSYVAAYNNAMNQLEVQKQQFVAMHRENLERMNRQYEMPQRQLPIGDEVMPNYGAQNGGPNAANLNDNSLENPADNSFNYDGQAQDQ